MNLPLFSSGFMSFARYVFGRISCWFAIGILSFSVISSTSFICAILCRWVQRDLIFSSKVLRVTSEYGSGGVVTRAGISGKGSNS